MCEVVPARRHADVLKPGEQRLEGNSSFKACQRRTKAKVDPLAESDVSPGAVATNVETLRVVELPSVPVGRRVHYDQARTRRDPDPPSSVSRVARRPRPCTGDSRRRASSIMFGISDAFSIKAFIWPGFRSSNIIALPIRFVVVSLPATRSCCSMLSISAV